MIAADSSVTAIDCSPDIVSNAICLQDQISVQCVKKKRKQKEIKIQK